MLAMDWPPSRNRVLRERFDRWWEAKRASGTLSESPIEELIKDALVVADGVSRTQQVPIAGYRADFVLRGAAAIAIECDGKEFHHRRDDRRREHDILRTGTVSRIYRFPGYAIFHALDACLAVVAAFDPWIFRPGAEHLAAGEKLRREGDAYLRARIYDLGDLKPGEREYQLSWGSETRLDDASVLVVSRFADGEPSR
jgi:very-short-patch-repair endonuclease